jgi:hypothetical protein
MFCIGALLATMFCLGVSTANAVGPTKEPFCEVSQGTGAKNCEYRTMEQCQAAIKGKTSTCVANPEAPAR